jgi:hypothetical protein
MFRLLTAVIASGLVFGFTAAIGQTLDTGTPRSGDYKTAKQTCGPGQTGTQQCAKDAAAAPDIPRMQCEKLKDRAKRECVLEAFVQQHDRMIVGGRNRE